MKNAIATPEGGVHVDLNAEEIAEHRARETKFDADRPRREYMMEKREAESRAGNGKVIASILRSLDAAGIALDADAQAALDAINQAESKRPS